MPGTRPEDVPVFILCGGQGTRLGEALFIGTETDADGRRVFSTEGGHADFGPRDDLEIDLLRFLRARHGRVSTERVVSGQGIADLYDFVVTRGHAETTDAVRDAIEGGADPGATIGEAALAERDAALKAFQGIESVRIIRDDIRGRVENLIAELVPAGERA